MTESKRCNSCQADFLSWSSEDWEKKKCHSSSSSEDWEEKKKCHEKEKKKCHKEEEKKKCHKKEKKKCYSDSSSSSSEEEKCHEKKKRPCQKKKKHCECKKDKCLNWDPLGRFDWYNFPIYDFCCPRPRPICCGYWY